MAKKSICPVCGSEEVEYQHGFSGVVACSENKIPEPIYSVYLCKKGHYFNDVPDYALE